MRSIIKVIHQLIFSDGQIREFSFRNIQIRKRRCIRRRIMSCLQVRSLWKKVTRSIRSFRSDVCVLLFRFIRIPAIQKMLWLRQNVCMKDFIFQTYIWEGIIRLMQKRSGRGKEQNHRCFLKTRRFWRKENATIWDLVIIWRMRWKQMQKKIRQNLWTEVLRILYQTRMWRQVTGGGR